MSSRNKSQVSGVSKRILSMPLLIVELFFVFTLVLYFFGPSKYEKDNSLFLLIMLSIYHLAFILGYILEINKVNCDQNMEEKLYVNSDIKKQRMLRFTKIVIVVGLISTIISTIVYANISLLSPYLIIERVLYSFNNPLGAYSESFSGRDGGIIYTLLVVIAPVSWAAFPLSVAFFKKLPIMFKGMTIIMFILEAIRWIVNGRSKGVFDLAIIISGVIMMKFLQDQYTRKRDVDVSKAKREKRKLNPIRTLLVIVILVSSAISYFTNAIGSRTQYYEYSSSIYNSPLMRITPVALHPTIIYLTDYLTQGYHAFSQLIEVDWTPMFGIGNSTFLTANFSSLLGHDFFQYTYQAKLMSQGINPYAAWHTFYTWVANDVHWVGVIVIMFVLGKYFAFIAKRNIMHREIITYPLICLMFIVILYMSGNNQVFSQSNTFMTFWCLTAFWYLIRKKIFFSDSVFGYFEKYR